MKELRLLQALGTVDARFPEEAMEPRHRRRWPRVLAAAACLCLVCGAGLAAMFRLGYLTAGCSAWPGTFVGGAYYHTVQHEGIYRWDGTSNEKVLGAFWNEGWLANDYGIYYKTRRSLYVLPHEGAKTKLFTAGVTEASHIGFSFYGENVVVRIYNKHKEQFSEVLVDGRTGELLAEVTTLSPYSLLYDGQAFSDTHLLVGAREIVLQDGILTENGLPLLTEQVSRYYSSSNGLVWFTVEENWSESSRFFLLRPDGKDRPVMLPVCNCADIAGDFAFWVDYEQNTVCCADTRTGEWWTLHVDTESEFYEIVTDGVHLFSCVPWDDYQRLWQVEYEAERPVSLTLLDNDICE